MLDTLVQSEDASRETTLVVKTLGGFSITYQGREISFGSQAESQIVHLLQLLLHFRETGVTRDLARAELFGDRKIDDVSHSIRNIIYNLRKKLKELGFPDSQFVEKRGGVYFWCSDIPVKEDASDFEQAYHEAMDPEHKSERQGLLMATVWQYTGRFLDGTKNGAWADAEAERYRKMFAEAVDSLADILRSARQFKALQETGIYATNVDPFSEWEILTLEAMSGLGQFDKTESFYKETVDAYIREFGSKSGSYVKEFANRIGLKLVIGHESLEEIQEKLRNKDFSNDSGYFCSLPVFQEIYRVAERKLAGEGNRAFLMLCTLTDSKGEPLLSGARLEDLASRLRSAILSSVQYSDTVTRYSRGQYLVLMLNTTYDKCSDIASLIDSKFIKSGQKTCVSYAARSIAAGRKDHSSELANAV